MQPENKNPNFWRRRTTLERCLSKLNTIGLLIAIALMIGLVSVIQKTQVEGAAAHLQDSGSTQPQHNMVLQETSRRFGHSPKHIHDATCLTPECINTASMVISKLKPEIEPCDDFYRFACGSYLDKAVIPDDKTSIDTFSATSDQLQEQLRELIEEEQPETEPKHIQLPNLIYKACMNKTLIETLGTTPITDIAESLGGWPLIKGNAWDPENTWTWQETTKKFRRVGLGVDYLIDFAVNVDFKNGTRRLIELDDSDICLSREYLIKGRNDPVVAAYYEFMVDIAVLFGADEDTAKKELGESLQFEIDLANISLANEERRNSSQLYNIRTVGMLQKAYPYVQWLDYINALLPKGLKVNENEHINLIAPSFFDQLGPLLAKTPKRVIANYMMWRIHESSVNFLPEVFRERQLKYEAAVSGQQEQEPRWKECVDFVTNRLAELVGSLYVRKYFQEDSKANALEMVNNIKRVFSDILDEVDWMDPITKKAAKIKLQKMTNHIGYPDEILDNSKLQKYYRLLEINPNKYFLSFLNTTIFKTDYLFNKLRLPVNKTDWESHAKPAVVNAFYSLIENSIQFPAGILQGYFFNAQRPKYMNYGAIGFIIGHEITHGFDDEGRQFDVDGNLVDWWQPSTQEAFLEKARCIIDQYGNYTERQTGLNLNGINTQGENIADNGGVKESYIAYRKWVQRNGPEPKLPGLEYTPEQMFWISAAQTWCSKQRLESLQMSITTDAHSPSEFRVLGSLSNTNEFSKDFRCPEGSTMNPVKKCKVW